MARADNCRGTILCYHYFNITASSRTSARDAAHSSFTYTARPTPHMIREKMVNLRETIRRLSHWKVLQSQPALLAMGPTLIEKIDFVQHIAWYASPEYEGYQILIKLHNSVMITVVSTKPRTTGS